MQLKKQRRARAELRSILPSMGKEKRFIQRKIKVASILSALLKTMRGGALRRQGRDSKGFRRRPKFARRVDAKCCGTELWKHCWTDITDSQAARLPAIAQLRDENPKITSQGGCCCQEKSPRELLTLASFCCSY